MKLLAPLARMATRTFFTPQPRSLGLLLRQQTPFSAPRISSAFACCISARQFQTSTLDLDHYSTLEVASSASTEEIKQAYLKLSKKFHPDKNAHVSQKQQETAEAQFLEIAEAFKVLSDTAARQQYDSARASGYNGTYQSYQAPSYQYPEYEIHHGKSPYQIFSNSAVVFGLVIWVCVGIIWHYITISKTKTELELFLEERSRAAAASHALARQRAKENGYKKQLEILRMKVEAN